MMDLLNKKEVWGLAGVIIGSIITGFFTYRTTKIKIKEQKQQIKKKWIENHILKNDFYPVLQWLENCINMINNTSINQLRKCILIEEIKSHIKLLDYRFHLHWIDKFQLLSNCIVEFRSKLEIPDTTFSLTKGAVSLVFFS